MKKHLIITDNVRISTRLLEVNKRLGISDLFVFACSNLSSSTEYPFYVEQYDLKNAECLKYINSSFNYIFSVHCKQLFPNSLVSNHICFNLHPGYNPVNRGWYPQVFAILYDLPIGATFHIIDEELDNGDIIARRFVEKKEYDTSYTLYNRIIECEISLWEENILSVLEDNYKRRKPEDSGNLFLKRDFNTLLNLNLQNVGTLQDHITLLRALTFDGYKNAYYFDSEGVKVYVSISLSREK